MTSLTPRQVKAQQTKKRILEVALELFSKKGFDQVTVDEIVSASNTSKGAFYVHFNSKYEIFLEKFKEIDDFYENFIETLPKDMKCSEKIMNLVKSQMLYLRDDLGRDLLRTVYMSALIPNQPKTLSNTDRKLFKIIHSIVQEGQEKGEFTNHFSVKEITMLITRCMRGTLYDWLIFNDENFDLIEESQKFLRPIIVSIQNEK
ncbi:TetR/AcrR family transcriptional regulator [Calidifontibacillus erzurumensis]|uniref:TetR/AcrR family transcriptional regulator n=1 Tax=Calidifontibacillus erzurumensis TaxID=2741433 RepID=A0A8J8GGG3_9BACI|nr:TetR/AcrR family transcriptional regulator [Calidifontibacillus erzurumensis]NSL52691.1 TetR/AcrR family transcriptional regulator [Calidifontibacillus erzurumensis]